MKKTILVIDDFENTRWVIEITLKSFDCEFLSASDGMEALKFIDGRKIDLIITDYNMPRMNGYEFVKEVRSTKGYEFIPIIMVTTETDTNKKKLAEDVKVTTWLQKPFKSDMLIKLVQKCLK